VDAIDSEPRSATSAGLPDPVAPDAPPRDAAPPWRGSRSLSAARAASPVLQGLLALAIYLAVFVIGFGLPLIRHLNVPNLRQYWTDPQFYIWSMRWWPYAVTHWTNPLFSSQIGAPRGYDLAWASTTPSVDLLMWPVTALFGVLVSYNVMLLLVPPVAAWAAFVVARRLTGRFWAALLAGAVYGFSPYELIHNWQGQPNLTVIALFPIMVYLVLRWWDGALRAVWYVVAMAVAMAAEFYTFNEAFAEMTAVLVAGLLIGFAVAGRASRGTVARLAVLTGIAFGGAVALSAPYLVYSLRHDTGALTRQNPAFSLQMIRLIVPTSQQMFGLTPLINYSNRLGRAGIDDYVGLPLLVILLLLLVFAWRNRLYRLLFIGVLVALALGAGPYLVLDKDYVLTLPWSGLWRLPIVRSAEPSRFIVFVSLGLALALALWLAPRKDQPEDDSEIKAEPVARASARAWGRWAMAAARWALGLLAVAALVTDAPTSYQAVTPVPPGQQAVAGMHPVNQLPAFLTEGLYRQYLRPGEIVVILTGRGNAGMLFQADANFYFRIAGGYINASLTPVNALPHPVTVIVDPSKDNVLTFEDYVRSAGVGAIIVEQSWALPWSGNFAKIGMHGTSAGGVTIYPVAPWLAGLAHPARSSSGRPAPAAAASASGRSGAGASALPVVASSPENTDDRLHLPDEPRCDGTFSDTNASAPVGIGSQKFTTRQPSTPSVATPLLTPKPTSSSGRIESTTPRPPGVIGSAPATLAMP
jgi:hypothetical protein